jgi:hypothetical protein
MGGHVKVIYIAGVLLLIFLMGGSVDAARPVSLPHVDYDCDGEITVADALSIVPHFGAQDAVALWAYDLDRDGAVTELDVHVLLTQIGRTDLPAPVWCGMTFEQER